MIFDTIILTIAYNAGLGFLFCLLKIETILIKRNCKQIKHYHDYNLYQLLLSLRTK